MVPKKTFGLSFPMPPADNSTVGPIYLDPGVFPYNPQPSPNQVQIQPRALRMPSRVGDRNKYHQWLEGDCFQKILVQKSFKSLLVQRRRSKKQFSETFTYSQYNPNRKEKENHKVTL